MAKNTVSMRVDPEFKKLLRDISIERIKIGKDREQLKTPRLTKALTRIPDLKQFMVNSEIKKRI